MSSQLLKGVCLPVLQVLDAAETSEPAIHHDGHPGAQSFTLLHTGTHTHTVNTHFKVLRTSTDFT